MKRECSTCEFCADGLCRRMPPQTVLWPSDNQHPIAYHPCTTWPNVSATDWCGEWKSAPWGLGAAPEAWTAPAEGKAS